MFTAASLFTVALLIVFVLVIVPLVYWILLGVTMVFRRRRRR